MLFRQLFEKDTSTYTYLLADGKDAVLIDTTDTTVDRDLKLIQELGLELKYVLDTHVHADHVTGFETIYKKNPKVKHVIGKKNKMESNPDHLQLVEEGDKISFGKREIEVIETPGHTVGCLTFVLDDKSAAFTGDALLIRKCGRTDFQGGSAETLFSSVRDKIFKLPDSCVLYPGHDYVGLPCSTVAEEKKYNERLNLSIPKEEFVKIMDGLNLQYPRYIDVAVPANIKGGVRQ